MSDRDSFLKAIIARPFDDLPRLVYCDWLEESGESDHAEFIRLQIKIATDGMGADDWIRQRDLLNSGVEKWFADVPGQWRSLAGNRGTFTIEPANGWTFYLRRGFVESVRIRLNELLGKPCGSGHGSDHSCRHCCNSPLLDLFATQPVVAVETEMRPLRQPGGSGFLWTFWQYHPGARIRDEDLPPAIWQRLTGRDHSHLTGIKSKGYASSEDAQTDLARVLAEYGREAYEFATGVQKNGNR